MQRKHRSFCSILFTTIYIYYIELFERVKNTVFPLPFQTQRAAEMAHVQRASNLSLIFKTLHFIHLHVKNTTWVTYKQAKMVLGRYWQVRNLSFRVVSVFVGTYFPSQISNLYFDTLKMV